MILSFLETANRYWEKSIFLTYQQKTLLMGSSDTHRYYPQLDGIRAIAILLVMLSHWTHLLIDYVSLGDLGVRLFFVLSGFLIGRILMVQRREVENRQLENIYLSQILKSFYIRRALRIFPIYYVFLLFVWVIGFEDAANSDMPWYLTYTTNFKIMLNGDSGFLNHLWSLACEEQFYIILPWLLVLIPSRHHLRVVWSIMIVGLCVRAGMSIASVPHGDFFILSVFSDFGIGIWVAYRRVVQKPIPYRDLVGWTAFCIMLLIVFGLKKRELLQIIPVVPIFFAFLIDKAFDGWQGFGGWLLGNPVSVYIGKISYGIYLLHYPLPLIRYMFLTKAGIMIGEGWQTTLLDTAILLLVTYLSFYYFESPINRQKKRFPYLPKKKPQLG